MKVMALASMVAAPWSFNKEEQTKEMDLSASVYSPKSLCDATARGLTHVRKKLSDIPVASSLGFRLHVNKGRVYIF